MIGNAVPVNLAKHLALQIKADLSSVKNTKKDNQSGVVKDYTKVAQVTLLQRQIKLTCNNYLKQIVTHHLRLHLMHAKME